MHIGPTIDYLERAFDASKYGEISSEPYLDVAFPTLLDPSLAPPGRHVHVGLHAVRAVQARERAQLDLDAGHAGHHGAANRSSATRPASPLDRRQRVLTPVDLETTYGLTGGHILHGEPSLDQLFTMRPVLGWAQYRTPIDGLFLCGAGTHPGGGLTAASGQNAAREIIRALKKRRAASA